MKRELVVILPAYNEAENIERLVDRLESQADPLNEEFGIDLRVVIINDGSKDNTESLLNNLEKLYSWLSHVTHESNKGLGKALETGIIHVMNSYQDCAYVLIMDCDNTHDPRYIIPMMREIQNPKSKDVVIASRYRKGSKIFGVPLYRLIISYGARFVYTIALHLNGVRDYTCGFRLYNIEALRLLNIKFRGRLIEEDGFACMVELLYKLHIVGSLLGEVPFELHYEDKRGDSKMQLTKTTASSLSLIKKLRNL